MQTPAFAEHIDSYYAASRRYRDTYPKLSGSLKVDTCVVGGGLAGIGTALPLAQQGRSVAVLEAARIGFGASGRNGGQVIAGYSCDIQTIADQVGEKAAQAFWQISTEAVSLVHQQVAQFGIECDWHRGYATVAVKPRQMDDLLAYQQTMKSRYGYDVYTVWDKAQLQQQLASERYQGGLYDTDSGHIQPLDYCAGLARAAQAAGAQLFEHSPLTDIVQDGDGWRIRTPEGEVWAKEVVLAANVFSGSLNAAPFRTLAPRIMPVGTYVIATEPLGERADALIRNNMAVCDSNFVLDYYRLSADKRLLFGGKVSYSGQAPHDVGGAMRQDMLRVFPQLADVKIDYAWGGLVDISMSRAPDFGRLHPNLYYLQGFSGHGVALTGIGGKVVAEAILGDDSRLRLFEQLSHRRFPGGTYLRTPALVLAMAYYRLKDYL